jgi:biopolymer transport protein ExbD
MSRCRKRPRIHDAAMPLSSMIDIVFLLLIYFIVTQKLIVEDTLLGASMPGGKTVVTPPPPPPQFTVDNDHLNQADPALDRETYVVNHRRCSFDNLRDQLLRIGQLNADTTIMLRCGPNAPHQKLVRVLDACAEAELSNLNLITDPHQPFTPERFAHHYLWKP